MEKLFCKTSISSETVWQHERLVSFDSNVANEKCVLDGQELGKASISLSGRRSLLKDLIRWVAVSITFHMLNALSQLPHDCRNLEDILCNKNFKNKPLAAFQVLKSAQLISLMRTGNGGGVGERISPNHKKLLPVAEKAARIRRKKKNTSLSDCLRFSFSLVSTKAT